MNKPISPFARGSMKELKAVQSPAPLDDLTTSQQPIKPAIEQLNKPPSSQPVNIATPQPVNSTSGQVSDPATIQVDNPSKADEKVNAKYKSWEGKTVTFRLPDKDAHAFKMWCLARKTTIQDELAKYVYGLLDLSSSPQLIKPASKQIPYKEHARVFDDLDNNNNLNQGTDNYHHQSVRDFYRNITGKLWTSADDDEYHKIKHFPLEQIKNAMREIRKRAGEKRIGTFGYFATGIVKELQFAAPVQAELALDAIYQGYANEMNQDNDDVWRWTLERKLEFIKTCAERDGRGWEPEIAASLF